jgi:hypothetical protein
VIPFLVEYRTDYDTDCGGSAVVYAEDEGEALIKSEDYCQIKISEEIDDIDADFSVNILVKEFNNLEDGDIRDYEVID